MGEGCGMTSLFEGRRQRRIREQLHDAILQALTTDVERDKRPRSVQQYLDCDEVVALLDHVNRLEALLGATVSYPRFLSIGSTDNAVELRIGREKYEEIRAILETEAISLGTG